MPTMIFFCECRSCLLLASRLPVVSTTPHDRQTTQKPTPTQKTGNRRAYLDIGGAKPALAPLLLGGAHQQLRCEGLARRSPNTALCWALFPAPFGGPWGAI
jgi:hypothetical protein